jgi:hypothetical protein
MDSIPAANVFQSASATIQRAVAGLSRDAATVAASSITQTGKLLPALIDSRQQLLYTQAGAKMIETANQMMGSLLDIRA